MKDDLQAGPGRIQELPFGLLTFHWATNYGAVLQAYALWRYLTVHGLPIEILNYVPRRVHWAQRVGWLRGGVSGELLREYRISRFLRARGALSSSRYGSFGGLRRASGRYRGYVVGSDQIWNESFTLRAEGRPTLSYFAAFDGDRSKRKVGYAVSFGAEQLSERMLETVEPAVETFSHVSARELSGGRILAGLGIQAPLVVDPTLLLPRSDYDSFLRDSQARPGNLVAYVLHPGQDRAWQVVNEVGAELNLPDFVDPVKQRFTVEQWLSAISSAKFVVTNSYHGVIFAILYRRPFVCIPVEGQGKGMNDRVLTLLGEIALRNRVVSSETDLSTVRKLAVTPIEWDLVMEGLAPWVNDSKKYLAEALGI